LKNILIRFFQKENLFGLRVPYLHEANRNRKLDLYSSAGNIRNDRFLLESETIQPLRFPTCAIKIGIRHATAENLRVGK